MPTQAEGIAAALGLTGVSAAEPVGGGMSGAALWRLGRDDGADSDLLLRIQRGTGHGQVLREAELQRHAAAAGLPVPPVVAVADVDGDVVIAMGWVDAEPMVETLTEQPERVTVLGAAAGELLARLHRVPLPPPATTRTTFDRWLEESDEWLRRAIAPEPGAARLIHADFHPANLLVGPTGDLTLIDWTNATVGHPFVDLGRTFACLRLGAALFGFDPATGPLDTWWRALLGAYGAADRTLDELAPFFAFGLLTLIGDFRVTGAAIPAAISEELAGERDDWLEVARRFADRPRLT